MLRYKGYKSKEYQYKDYSNFINRTFKTKTIKSIINK